MTFRRCISYCSAAITKHHHQGHLWKKEFIGAYSSRRLDSIMAGRHVSQFRKLKAHITYCNHPPDKCMRLYIKACTHDVGSLKRPYLLRLPQITLPPATKGLNIQATGGYFSNHHKEIVRLILSNEKRVNMD